MYKAIQRWKHLEVGSGVGTDARVVVLLQVRLERRRALRLVSQGRAGAGHQVGIILGDTVLLLAPHTPAHERDTSEQESTADTANHAPDNGLVLVAYASTTRFGVGLGRKGLDRHASGGEEG